MACPSDKYLAKPLSTITPQTLNIFHAMYYCTFFLRCDDPDGATKIFASDSIAELEFEDNDSEFNLAQTQRFRDAGFMTRSDLPRYRWLFHSKGSVDSDEMDPFVHVSWLMSQLKPDVSLAQARKHGMETSLGFYWGGNGTGGGPFISVRLAELLVRHKIDMDVGFYYEESEGVASAH